MEGVDLQCGMSSHSKTFSERGSGSGILFRYLTVVLVGIVRVLGGLWQECGRLKRKKSRASSGKIAEGMQKVADGRASHF